MKNFNKKIALALFVMVSTQAAVNGKWLNKNYVANYFGKISYNLHSLSHYYCSKPYAIVTLIGCPIAIPAAYMLFTAEKGTVTVSDFDHHQHTHAVLGLIDQDWDALVDGSRKDWGKDNKDAAKNVLTQLCVLKNDETCQEKKIKVIHDQNIKPTHGLKAVELGCSR